MSFAKRVLFGDDARDDPLRKERAAQAEDIIEAYRYRIPTRRKNHFASRRRWDPAWESCLTEAADTLKIQYRCTNAQIGFLSESDRDAVRTRAEELHVRMGAELRRFMEK